MTSQDTDLLNSFSPSNAEWIDFENLVFYCETRLFHLSYVTKASCSADELAELSKIVSFLKRSCTFGHKFQSFLFENHMHALVDGYCGYFYEKEQSQLVIECLKFYVNFVANHSKCQEDVFSRLFIQGNLGLKLLCHDEYREFVLILSLNCLKPNSSLCDKFCNTEVFHYFIVGFLKASGRDEVSYLEVELFNVFISHISFNSYSKLDLELKSIFLKLLVKTGPNSLQQEIAKNFFLQLQNNKFFDLNALASVSIEKLEQNSLLEEISLNLEFISFLNLDWSSIFDDIQLMQALKTFFLFTFSSSYNHKYCFQSNILLILANVLNNLPQALQIFNELEFLPCILKCTPIDDIDGIRREAVFVLLRILIDIDPEVAERIPSVISQLNNK